MQTYFLARDFARLARKKKNTANERVRDLSTESEKAKTGNNNKKKRFESACLRARERVSE